MDRYNLPITEEPECPEVSTAETSTKDPLEIKTEELVKQAEAVCAPPAGRPIDISFNRFFDTYQLDKLGILPGTLKMDPVPPGAVPVPPQGLPLAAIVRNKEMAAKVPEQIKHLLLDPAGNPLPEWVQVANLFHRPHKKVSIVGFADTRDECPFSDPTMEIWGINDLHRALPRYDRWFDIHVRDNIQADVKAGRSPADACGLEPLKHLNVPVYMQEAFPDIPTSIRFPAKEIMDRFGRYFTNSISFLIALAILENYEEIHIYGVDMAVGKEYIKERPSVEYMIGIARGRGIKVVIPDACDLLKTRFVYAYEEKRQGEMNDKFNKMMGGLQSRHQMSYQQEQQAHDARMQYEGAMGGIREYHKIWSNLADQIQV
jgi:hypothetical protein